MIQWIVTRTDLRSVQTKADEHNIHLNPCMFSASEGRPCVSPAAENSFPMLSIVMPRREEASGARAPVHSIRDAVMAKWGPDEKLRKPSPIYLATFLLSKKHLDCVENPLIELAVQRTMQFAPQCDRYLGQFWLLLKLSIVGAALLLCYQNIYKWAMIVESRKFHRDEASCWKVSHRSRVPCSLCQCWSHAGLGAGAQPLQCVLHTVTVGKIIVWSLHQTGGVLTCLLFCTTPHCNVIVHACQLLSPPMTDTIINIWCGV